MGPKRLWWTYISAQNLRSQATIVERSLGNVAETIREDTLARNKEQIDDRSERPAIEESFIEGNNYQCNTNSESQEQHLHTQSDLPALSRDGPTPLNNEVIKIIKAARPILASVIINPGDFNNRVSDTRTRKRPTIGDITDINGAIDVLIRITMGPVTSLTQLRILLFISG